MSISYTNEKMTNNFRSFNQSHYLMLVVQTCLDSVYLFFWSYHFGWRKNPWIAMIYSFPDFALNRSYTLARGSNHNLWVTRFELNERLSLSLFLSVCLSVCLYLSFSLSIYIHIYHNNSLIYLFRCSCSSRYIGRTNQWLYARIKQHISMKACNFIDSSTDNLSNTYGSSVVEYLINYRGCS